MRDANKTIAFTRGRDAIGAARRAVSTLPSEISRLHALVGNRGIQRLLDARAAVGPAPTLPSWHQERGVKVEELGRTACDLDQAKMTWSVDVAKLPLCMSDCARDHEL